MNPTTIIVSVGTLSFLPLIVLILRGETAKTDPRSEKRAVSALVFAGAVWMIATVVAAIINITERNYLAAAMFSAAFIVLVVSAALFGVQVRWRGSGAAMPAGAVRLTKALTLTFYVLAGVLGVGILAMLVTSFLSVVV